jgi:hypothetical protein
MLTKEEFMKTLGYTEEEALAALKDADELVSRKTGMVCVCGHSMGRHDVELGMGGVDAPCTAGKNNCPCRTPRAVIKVENARGFLRKTSGSGPFHALGLGITDAITKGQSIEWLVDMVCDGCHAEVESLAPAALEVAGGQAVVVNRPSKMNALLCPTCRLGV